MSRRSILERLAGFEEKRFEGSLGYDYENDGRGLMISATTSSSAASGSLLWMEFCFGAGWGLTWRQAAARSSLN